MSKSPKNPLHGWINFYKPEGMTSTQAVTAVKRLLRPEKIGHAGTLDPLASGVLPLALGDATKTVAYAMDMKKTYFFTVQFGVQTTTDDREGQVVSTCDIIPSGEQIEAVLPRFTGVILQQPPIFSALKVAGQRAYDLARAGETPALAPREIYVESLKLLEIDNNQASFVVRCGKGTYIRSLARDISAVLGSCGHVKVLQRQSVGPFDEKNAFSLESLEEILHIHPRISLPKGAELEFLAPLDIVLDDIPAVQVDTEAAAKLRHGQAIFVFALDAFEGSEESPKGQTLYKVILGGRVIALAERKGRMVHPVRVFSREETTR